MQNGRLYIYMCVYTGHETRKIIQSQVKTLDLQYRTAITFSLHETHFLGHMRLDLPNSFLQHGRKNIYITVNIQVHFKKEK